MPYFKRDHEYWDGLQKYGRRVRIHTVTAKELEKEARKKAAAQAAAAAKERKERIDRIIPLLDEIPSTTRTRHLGTYSEQRAQRRKRILQMDALEEAVRWLRFFSEKEKED